MLFIPNITGSIKYADNTLCWTTIISLLLTSLTRTCILDYSWISRWRLQSYRRRITVSPHIGTVMFLNANFVDANSCKSKRLQIHYNRPHTSVIKMPKRGTKHHLHVRLLLSADYMAYQMQNKILYWT